MAQQNSAHNLKVAFLTPEFPHERINSAAGIGTSIKNLAFALKNHGVEVFVFVYGQKEDAIFDDQGIKIQTIKSVKFPFFSWYFSRKHIQRIVNHQIRHHKIDLLEAPDWTGITAFMSAQVPIVIRMHGSDAYFCKLENRKQKPKNFLFENLALKGADAYIAPTRFAADLTTSIFSLNNTDIKVIHYGLELQKFVNTGTDEYEDGLIVYVGTLIRKKGVLELPAILSEVLQDYPQARLMLIGADSSDLLTKNPSTWNLLTTGVSAHVKSKIEYLGPIPYSELQSILKRAHVCVFPTFAETLGMVTIESMAMSKAVVSSDFGWSREIINDGVNGFLSDPTQHAVFAERISTILRDDQLRRNIGVSARARVEKVFDIENIVRENIVYYDEIVKKYNNET